MQSERQKLQASWEEQNKLVERLYYLQPYFDYCQLYLITWLSKAAVPLIRTEKNQQEPNPSFCDMIWQRLAFSGPIILQITST